MLLGANSSDALALELGIRIMTTEEGITPKIQGRNQQLMHAMSALNAGLSEGDGMHR